MLNLLKLIRPHHYLKNLFIFLPAFFAGRAADTSLYFPLAITFISFCLTASAVYIFNDIRDRTEDQNHPIKKDRPLASGKISLGFAIGAMFVFLGLGLGLSFLINLDFLFILSIYVLLNFLYSLHLKKIAILDLFIIALGFILRLFAGSVATDVPLSMWIIIMTFLLALFLAMAKRRSDYLLSQKGHDVRKNIEGYNLPFINTSLSILAGVTVVAYIMYTTSPFVLIQFESDRLYLTTIFVLFGLLRYLQLALVEEKSGSPTKVLMKDFYLQVTLLAWMISFFLIIY